MSPPNSGQIPSRVVPDPAIPSVPVPVETVESLSIRVRMLEDRIEENTELTQKSLDTSERVEKSTATLVEFANNATGALNTLNWLIKVLKPIIILVLGFTAIWGIFNAAKAYVIAAVANGSIK